MAVGPETRLVNRIKRAIEAEHPSSWVLKTHGGPYQQAGVPDLLVSLGGLVVGLEVKCQRPGESVEAARRRVTVRQALTLEAMRGSGAVAEVVVTVEEALSVLRNAA